MTTTNNARGHFAEKIAMLFLMGKGYRPICLNYTVGRGTGAGEVDLIMKRGNTLIFVEVKYRSTLAKALEAITPENQMRVARTSAVFLARNPRYQYCQIRYDAVVMSPRRWPKHIPGAWRIL